MAALASLKRCTSYEPILSVGLRFTYFCSFCNQPTGHLHSNASQDLTLDCAVGMQPVHPTVRRSSSSFVLHTKGWWKRKFVQFTDNQAKKRWGTLCVYSRDSLNPLKTDTGWPGTSCWLVVSGILPHRFNYWRVKVQRVMQLYPFLLWAAPSLGHICSIIEVSHLVFALFSITSNMEVSNFIFNLRS